MRFGRILSVLDRRSSATRRDTERLDPPSLDIPWQRWSAARMASVRSYLQRRPRDDYTAEDWLTVAEWLVSRYVPEGTIKTSSDYDTIKSKILKKIQNNITERATRPSISTSPFELIQTPFPPVPTRELTLRELSILRYAREHAADTILDISSNIRVGMRRIINEHVQAQVLGQTEGTSRALEQRLFDEFGALNRDFQRIAITEVGEITNQGVVAATPIGGKLRRVEAYRGACKFCQSINDKVFTVVDPSSPEKDEWTEIWMGKTNIGRAPPDNCCDPDDGLRCDNPTTLWWPAAGLQHSMCGGSWLPVSEKPPNVSQEFNDWLQAKLKEAGLPVYDDDSKSTI